MDKSISLLAMCIKEWNEKEYKFRTIKRKLEHPDWCLKKVKTRKIIDIDGKEYQYNLGVYYVRYFDENGKEKRREFTYYHNEYLAQMKRSKYSLEIKKIAYEIRKNGGKRPEFLPKSTFLYWSWMTKKNIELKTDLDEKIKQSLKSSFNKLKKFEIKPEHNNILFVEIDDTYKRIQYKKMNKKFMCRMMTFNLFNSKTGKYEALNNVQIYFEQDKRLTKYDEKNKLIELTNYIKNTYYDSKMKVCVKGDGAYNIKNLAKNFDYYILDKFHVLKYVKDTFTLKKYIQNKDLKELNAQFYQIKSPTFWKNAINYYSINDWDNLYLKLKKWFDNFEFKTNFKKQFEKFLNYLNNNKRAIFGILDGIERTSHTESYIRNFFKIYLDKRNASYGFETMTELVKNNFNYENGLLQIF